MLAQHVRRATAVAVPAVAAWWCRRSRRGGGAGGVQSQLSTWRINGNAFRWIRPIREWIASRVSIASAT